MNLLNKLGTGLALGGAVAGVSAQALAADGFENSRTKLVEGVSEMSYEFDPSAVALMDLIGGAQDSGDDGFVSRIEGAVGTSVVPEGELKGSPLSVFMNTGIHSKYRVDGGFALSEGAVNQSIFDVSMADALGEGTRIGAYVWENFDFNTNGFTELDVGGYVSFPIAERFAGGKLGGDLELAVWDFGNFADGTLGPSQSVGLMSRLNYSGLVDLTIELTQMLSDGCGREYDLIASKPFDLGKFGDFDLAITPQASVSYLENFFGVDGLSNIQYGAGLSATRGNFSIEGYIEQQEPFKDDFESGPVFGARMRFGF